MQIIKFKFITCWICSIAFCFMASSASGQVSSPTISNEYNAVLDVFEILWESKGKAELKFEDGEAGKDYVAGLIVDKSHSLKGLKIRGKCKFKLYIDSWLCSIVIDGRISKINMVFIPSQVPGKIEQNPE